MILLGHSYGGLCSLETALRTENLRALVLYEPPIPVGEHELSAEGVLTDMKALLDDGENERALVLFLREVVRVPSTELNALRSAPSWPARVDTVQTILRELPAADEYEFDAARFADMTIPIVLLAGSESPKFLKDATDVLNNALPNSQLVILDGQAHAAMNTAPERFVDEVIALIREPS